MTGIAPTLRVAAAQDESVPGDVAGNAVRAAALTDRAGAQGARVVVLPELFLPGYHPPTLTADRGVDVTVQAGGIVDDVRLEPLQASASRAGTTVLVGAAVSDGDGRYISLLDVGEDGEVREAYRKRFLSGPDEQRLFRPGSSPGTVHVDGWQLALSICYDGCFPEHARDAALAGAHAYLCSVAYFVGAEHRRDVYYRARAVENGMFVVLADAVGGPSPFTFGGGSAVFDPEGRAIASVPVGEPGVAVADLHLDLLERTRADHPMLADWRERLDDAAQDRRRSPSKSTA